MRDAIDWLLGLRTLRFGDEGVRFTFTYPLAPWVWALVVLAAVAVGAWCYRKLDGPRWWRTALAAARAGLLVLLAFLAAGPKLTRPNETVERDWMIVLADRSASMTVADVSAGAQPLTRDEQLRDAIARHSPGLAAAAKGRIALWMGFDSGAYELPPPAGASIPELAPPTGRRSDLGGAIEAALARAAARPVAGIVVLSDGRASDTLGRATLRRLASERIGIFPVPLGSPRPISDIAVRSVQGPGLAFVNDAVPVEAVVEHTGAADAAAASVQLIDTLTGRVLDERDVTFSGSGAAAGAPQRITLTGTPGTAGAAAWRVRVVPRGADLISDNNQQDLTVELVDRPLRVLYIDGYPRWEYRYLKNLFAREKSLSYASLLLAAGRRFLAEGNDEFLNLPATAQEWNRYDVIIIGDVRPEVFTPEQLEQLKRRVLIGGAGLLWIAGEGALPAAWRGTTLADLLPVSLSSEAGSIRPWDEPVVMRPTPGADRLGVLRLLESPENDSWWPPDVGDPDAGWSRLRWAQRIDRAALKPAAEVLAEGVPISGAPERGVLVATMRYGSGRTVYVATDEIWRWRYGRGEDLPERFWLQLVRLLGREAVARSGRPAILTATPVRSEIGTPVRISLELLDQQLLDASPSSVTVRISRTGQREGAPASPAAETAPPLDLTLRPATENSSADGRRVFTGAWVPGQTGLYRVTATDALFGADAVFTEAEVWLSDDEVKRPEADHPYLAQLARDTGGRVLSPADLDRLDQVLPRREVRLAGTPDEQTLWDTPLALILLVLLAAFEWVGRRLIRLA